MPGHVVVPTNGVFFKEDFEADLVKLPADLMTAKAEEMVSNLHVRLFLQRVRDVLISLFDRVGLVRTRRRLRLKTFSPDGSGRLSTVTVTYTCSRAGMCDGSL